MSECDSPKLKMQSQKRKGVGACGNINLQALLLSQTCPPWGKKELQKGMDGWHK